MDSKTMTFDDFLAKRESLVGKDIESCIGGDTYRGPITTIRLDSANLIFVLAWHAKFDMVGDDDWVAVERKSNGQGVMLILARSEISIDDLNEGRIRLVQSDGDYHVIFTQHQNIDPKKVKGLP